MVRLVPCPLCYPALMFFALALRRSQVLRAFPRRLLQVGTLLFIFSDLFLSGGDPAIDLEHRIGVRSPDD